MTENHGNSVYLCDRIVFCDYFTVLSLVEYYIRPIVLGSFKSNIRAPGGRRPFDYLQYPPAHNFFIFIIEISIISHVDYT